MSLSSGAKLLLERVSRAIEAHPGETAPAIRVWARASKRSGDAALEGLWRAGFIERRRVDGEWRYYHVTPYPPRDRPRDGGD